MSRRTALPPTASVAETAPDGRMSAPAAARNADAICAVLRDHAPREGHALELASGTGQHVAAFAAALPGLIWQPSEVDAQRRLSIDSYAAEHANIRSARHLDATAPGWGAGQAGQDLIVLVNLLHLVSASEARTLIDEVAQALAPNGMFALYGPFLRDGRPTSEGDAKFHASLHTADPAIGYKDVAEVLAWLAGAGLAPLPARDMPANNLMLIARQAA